MKKNKIIDATERSIFQLSKYLNESNGKPQSYACTKKTHATILKKNSSALS